MSGTLDVTSNSTRNYTEFFDSKKPYTEIITFNNNSSSNNESIENEIHGIYKLTTFVIRSDDKL